jgi:hypothetical protein
VHVFDPAATLCPDGVCRSHDSQGNLLYRDRDHLETRAVQQLAEPLRSFLQKRGLLAPAG